jgi:competence protein ComGC
MKKSLLLLSLVVLIICPAVAQQKQIQKPDGKTISIPVIDRTVKN